jgi:hypothetical protein
MPEGGSQKHSFDPALSLRTVSERIMNKSKPVKSAAGDPFMKMLLKKQQQEERQARQREQRLAKKKKVADETPPPTPEPKVNNVSEKEDSGVSPTQVLIQKTTAVNEIKPALSNSNDSADTSENTNNSLLLAATTAASIKKPPKQSDFKVGSNDDKTSLGNTAKEKKNTAVAAKKTKKTPTKSKKEMPALPDLVSCC